MTEPESADQIVSPPDAENGMESPAGAESVYEPGETDETTRARPSEAHDRPQNPPRRCKTCGQDALPGSFVCKDHPEKVVRGARKKTRSRNPGAFLVVVLIAALWLYPSLRQTATSQDTEGASGSLGALVSSLTGRESGPRPAADRKAAKAPENRESTKPHAAAGGADCGNGSIDSGELCDGTALGGASCASLGFAGDCGSDAGCPHPGLACLGNCRFDYSGCTAESQAAVQRFIDNGDATVTDRLTGLVWELKCVAAGCQAEHDVVAKLPWREAATRWVGDLNGARFAGHDDWRLPSMEELRTLLIAVPPCATPPCPAAALPRDGTAPAGYWSSTSFSLDRKRAWAISFGDGEAFTAEKDAALYFRAVRDG